MSLSAMISHMQMGQPSGPGPSGVSAPTGKPPAPDAGHHLKAAVAAHKAGDHAAAKKHALKAVNALHRMAAPAPAPAAPAPAAAAV